MNLSLDQKEKLFWNPAISPMEREPEIINIEKEFKSIDVESLPTFSLDGEWDMIWDGKAEDRLIDSKWEGAIKANVPCSVHTALLEAGLIPDPMVAINDKIAREYSYKEWWLRKSFKFTKGTSPIRLVFDGICYLAEVWLNGKYLGKHGGMFGGPEYDVTDLLKEENTLIVHIENAPADPIPYSEVSDHDEGWKKGVVINCVYGWHYACLPTRGIWRSVHLDTVTSTEIEKPFFATKDPFAGIVDGSIKLNGVKGKKVKIAINIIPDNFEGDNYSLSFDYVMKQDTDYARFRFEVPNPQVWWPNDFGAHPLYLFKVAVMPENELPHTFDLTFGLRSIEMAPLPGGPKEDIYNWSFVINGKPIFIKGANWCTIDALMRFDIEKYKRYLTLAAQQHIQLLRSWGGGITETDEFYRLCDEKGILVMQEWPICWDSERTQPLDELLDTVYRGVIRLRSHPSLCLWCGGNESFEAESKQLDDISRLTLELDGTRAYHRTEPYGGAKHDYSTYWDMKSIDSSLVLESPFLGEFGMASSPNIESVYRYLPENERNWPPTDKGSFCHHMPVFNEDNFTHIRDWLHLSEHVPEFCSPDTMESWILGTQMGQATVLRHALERNRTLWPNSAAVCYYKFTDVYPACSWATVDYYGVPKLLPYYIVQDSYEPLSVFVVFDSINAKEGLNAPIVIVDDTDALTGNNWQVEVKAYDEKLQVINSYNTCGKGSVNRLKRLCDFTLTKEETAHSPILITAEIKVENGKHIRCFYWLNYNENQGCLFNLPKTQLEYEIKDGKITISNIGKLPAVGVSVTNTAHDTEFTVEDNVFWLNSGEKRTLNINCSEGIEVKAWNS